MIRFGSFCFDSAVDASTQWEHMMPDFAPSHSAAHCRTVQRNRTITICDASNWNIINIKPSTLFAGRTHDLYHHHYHHHYSCNDSLFAHTNLHTLLNRWALIMTMIIIGVFFSNYSRETDNSESTQEPNRIHSTQNNRIFRFDYMSLRYVSSRKWHTIGKRKKANQKREREWEENTQKFIHWEHFLHHISHIFLVALALSTYKKPVAMKPVTPCSLFGLVPGTLKALSICLLCTLHTKLHICIETRAASESNTITIFAGFFFLSHPRSLLRPV